MSSDTPMSMEIRAGRRVVCCNSVNDWYDHGTGVQIQVTEVEKVKSA